MTTRKPNGRSSIYQTKDGKWHGRVSMGVKDDGSPDRRHVEAKTEAAVTRKVQGLEGKRDAGNVERAGRPLTVGAWLTIWLDTIAPRSASRSTIDSTYRPKVANWIIPRLGRHRLDRLQPEHLDAFYLWLSEQGLAENTVLQIHRILSRALKVAVMRGRVARNVATLVDAPSAVEIELTPLDETEARKVLAAARGTRNGARWSVALAAGLRQSEALGLRWQYVDLTTGEMRVWWQIQRRRHRHGCADPHACGAKFHRQPCPADCKRHKTRCPAPCRPKCTGHAQSCPKRMGGGYEFREPKGKGKRVVAIPPQLLSALKTHRASQAAERLAAGPVWEDWDLVFAQVNGKPIETHDDWEQWRDLLAAADLRHVRVHDARHTAATLLLEQGVDIRVVQEILGHSSITMTRRYTHVTSKLGHDAARRMGSALFEAN